MIVLSTILGAVIVVVLVIWAGSLRRQQGYRQKLIAFFTFIGGFYFFLEYLLPKKIGEFEFGYYHLEISKGLQVISVMAIGLGIGNLIRTHAGKVIKARAGWINSLALLIGLFGAFIVESADFRNTEQALKERSQFSNYALYVRRIRDDATNGTANSAHRVELLEKELTAAAASTTDSNSFLRIGDTLELPATYRAERTMPTDLENVRRQVGELRRLYGQPTSSETNSQLDRATTELERSLGALAIAAQEITSHNTEERTAKRLSHLIFQGFYAPLGSAMFALLAFYIASAAYRSFRIKSVEAVVMMLAALVVMLGQIPFGPLYISEDLPVLRLRLLENVSTPAFRAIYFGAAIAGLAMALRMWLSLERGPLAIDDSKQAPSTRTVRGRRGVS